MSLPLVYALLAWQQPAPPPTAPSVPQPIARVDVKPAEYALQVGDTVRLHAVAYDSSGRVMVDVTPIGRLTARAAGRATVTAQAGKTSASWTVVVTPNPVARVILTPADTAIRCGDVVRFVFLATDATRRTVADATPEWAVSPRRTGVRHDRRGRRVRGRPTRHLSGDRHARRANG